MEKNSKQTYVLRMSLNSLSILPIVLVPPLFIDNQVAGKGVVIFSFDSLSKNKQTNKQKKTNQQTNKKKNPAKYPHVK